MKNKRRRAKPITGIIGNGRLSGIPEEADLFVVVVDNYALIKTSMNHYNCVSSTARNGYWKFQDHYS